MLLVTGITGHSGCYFLKELVARGYQGRIRCLVRGSSDTAFLDCCGLSIDKRIGDLGDEAFVNEACQGVDTIFHIASIFHSVAIMRAAVNNGVKRAILVHTTGIYSQHKSASAEYKRIEATISNLLSMSNHKMDVVYLRPTMIYGYLGDRNIAVFIRLVDSLRLFPLIARGESLIQPVNGEDLGRAYYQVLTTHSVSGTDFVLSGARPIKMKDLFRLISDLLGKRTVFVSIPFALSIFAARLLKVLSLGRVDMIEKVQRMGEDRAFPHDEARRAFGYSPMPLEVGLEREVKAYLSAKCEKAPEQSEATQ